MKINKLMTAVLLSLMIMACDKENDDLVIPLTNFPQVLKFDDQGDGGLEDEDNFSFTITLNDKVDPSGKALGGTIIPLQQNAKIFFEIGDLEGFENITDYIKGWKAFYAIDDCTESDDLPMEFDIATGRGSVQFPSGVKEIEVEFETDDNYFNDDLVNKTERSLTIVLSNVEAEDGSVVVNSGSAFKYNVLDDESIHGNWELDHTNTDQFSKFKALFEAINEDIRILNAEEVDKIEISVEYNEVKILVELKETEMVEECGETEEVHKQIEIEADIEELSTLSTEGDLEFVGEIEQEDNTIKEFTYKGIFTITGSTLALTIQGEYEGNETDELTLLFGK